MAESDTTVCACFTKMWSRNSSVMPPNYAVIVSLRQKMAGREGLGQMLCIRLWPAAHEKVCLLLSHAIDFPMAYFPIWHRQVRGYKFGTVSHVGRLTILKLCILLIRYQKNSRYLASFSWVNFSSFHQSWIRSNRENREIPMSRQDHATTVPQRLKKSRSILFLPTTSPTVDLNFRP